MHPSVLPLARTLDMNTRLFLKCLDGVDDTMALERPKEGTNHVAFLALHMLDARYFILRTLAQLNPLEPRHAALRRGFTQGASGLIQLGARAVLGR